MAQQFSLRTCFDQWNRLQLFKLDSQRIQILEAQIKTKNKSAKNSLEIPKNFGYKCVCLTAKSIVNKTNELSVIVENIDPHIIGITGGLNFGTSVIAWLTRRRCICCRFGESNTTHFHVSSVGSVLLQRQQFLTSCLAFVER